MICRSLAVRLVTLAVALALCACPSKPDNTGTDGGQKPTDAGKQTPPDAGPGGTRVTLALRSFAYPVASAVGTGAWVAFQDGDGGWAEVSDQGSDGGFAFRVHDGPGRYGLAVQCPGTKTMDLVLTTTGESPSVHLSCPPHTSPQIVSQNLKSENWPGGTSAVHIDTGDSSFVSLNTPGGVLRNLPAATQDLAAVSLTGTPGRWSHGIIHHNVAVDGTGDVDFDFTSAFSNYTFNFNVMGLTAADTSRTCAQAIFTAHGSRLDLPVPTCSADTVSDGVPSTVLLGSDRIVLVASLNGSGGLRSDNLFVSSTQNVTLTPPPYLSSLGVSATHAPAQLLPKAQWSGGTPHPTALLEISQTSARQVNVLATNGWRAGATSLELPDLSGVSGFDATLAIDPGSSLDATLLAYDLQSGNPEEYLNVTEGDISGLLAGQRLLVSGDTKSYP